MENQCVFCNIVNREIPAKIVFENESIVCFLPKDLEVYGHTLVVPKKHYVDLFDIPSDILSDLMQIIQELTQNYKKSIQATGMNVLHASGIDAQQSIPHFHFHLLPRFKEDGVNAWPTLLLKEIDVDLLFEKIKVN
jgi:histidine triad (HIT) family protein